MRDYKIGDHVTIYRSSTNNSSWEYIKVGENCTVKYNRIQSQEDGDSIEIWTPDNGNWWHVMIADIRPTYWAVKWTDDSRWERVIDYMNSISHARFGGFRRSHYYGFDGNSNYKGFEDYGFLDEFDNNPFELTIDEWIGFNYDGLTCCNQTDCVTCVGDTPISPNTQMKNIPPIPEKWAIKIRPGNIDKIEAYRSQVKTRSVAKCKEHIGDYVLFGSVEQNGWIVLSFNDHTPITDEQFDYHVLKQTNMEKVSITRKQLLSLYADWNGCSDCTNTVKKYLDRLGILAGEESSITIDPVDIARIPQLKESQRKALEKYIKIPKEEKTYSIGDYFEVGIDKAILAQVDSGKVCLINLRGGNRYANPVEVGDVRKITKTELGKITSSTISQINVKITKVK